ncbi:MAG: tRNA adenosine(34) deaminase TadA [Lactobacillus sp.]|jgi:tRNA(adenine34) deaminase|nr:tRNA adenosine(34) deaminase TadA [Lactobacillus sp.]MCH3905944.1 tRNA adenosine(34) deaminase TadA [Lactobacillus sp.]MCH3990482.1 tRNA adenosine(34) deaminase TadA [Lactobacillus sp.]MCH4068803.1 tRNA adenosine(34) deaminase TadA [Lactobacillus sp.]MCI1304428.1 tRNA adenosine(34) deaminase TadA [Lactobacillus sp.]
MSLTSEQKKAGMQAAFEQAKLAADQGEIPIGAVIMDSAGMIIGRGYNRRELDQDATEHAEMLAIRQACQTCGSWRLIDCTLFVTLEPCPMCAGACINARVGTVVYGAFDPKAGACGSVVDLLAEPKFNHHPQVIRGFYQPEAKAMLQQFFRDIRQGKIQKPSQKPEDKLK